MPTILVVEDNAANRRAAVKWLSEHGFSIETAADGQAAIEAVQGDPPDLVLMDMNMPGVDGWEATKRIKSLPGMNDLPVIAVSASDLPEERDRALAAGCMALHRKPVDFPALLEQIEGILRSSSRREAHNGS